jgi:hypothetical protein
MFQFMDRDNSKAITRKEFLLHACDALKFDFDKYHRRIKLKQKDGGLICCNEHVVDDSFREVWHMCGSVVVCDIVILCSFFLCVCL